MHPPPPSKGLGKTVSYTITGPNLLTLKMVNGSFRTTQGHPLGFKESPMVDGLELHLATELDRR